MGRDARHDAVATGDSVDLADLDQVSDDDVDPADGSDAGTATGPFEPVVRGGDITEPVALHVSLGCRSRDSLLRCIHSLARVIDASDTAADIVGLRHELGIFRLTVAVPLGNVTDVVESRPAAVHGAQLLRAITGELGEFTPYLTPEPDEVQRHTLDTFLRAAPDDVEGTSARLIAAITQGRTKSEVAAPVVNLEGYDEGFEFFDSAAARTLARAGS